MTTMKRLILILGAILLGSMAMSAQNSLPAPGSGSVTTPAGGGWNPNTTVVVSPTYQDNGKVNVVGVGYDDEGVWRTIPMAVQYNYNGSQYSVTVLTAWNPWTDSWDTGLDIPAFNTSYRLDGTSYDFYVVLSTGTYYFNL